MEQNFPGSCEVIRQAFLRRGTPPSALDATIASLSKTTIAQYAKPLRLWWTFCERNHSNYFSPPVSRVLEFLAGSLTAVRSYSTLNSYRSAISLISSDEVGSHPLVKRFCRGVAVLKPQRSRYDFIWDASPVIAHLATRYPHEDLPLELVAKKLVTLLALMTAQRMQTLAAIRLSNVLIAESLVIRIPARLKTSGIGRSQPLLTFHPFLENPQLCIFSLTKHFLMRTKDLRPSDCDALFISFRSPFNPVSSQTLGRWVKAELETAGIDVAIFSAHSTRHASTSFAASKGINVEEIRRTAGWSKSSNIFASFYNRPIIKDSSFQSTILRAPYT